MTRRKKIIVGAVLVLLALLYTGAAATAGGSGSGSATSDPGGIVGWLGGLVGQPPAASRSDESAPCLSGDTLTIKDSCTLTVAKSDVRTRQVTVRATDALTVTTRAPNSDKTATSTAKAGSDIDVTVDSDGTDIVLACADVGATCVATLP